MQIEMPNFDDTGNIVDYIPMSLEFPYCVKTSNFLYEQYRIMDEQTCYEITVFRNGAVQLYKVHHDEANEKVTELSKLLGFRFWRFGMSKPEFKPFKLEEILKEVTGSFLFFSDIFAKYMI